MGSEKKKKVGLEALRWKKHAHSFKIFLNLENCSYFIFSYNFFKDRNVFLLISLGVYILRFQEFSISGPVSPSLIVLMRHGCYRPGLGEGATFSPRHVSHKKLFRVVCSLTNLSVKLFKQAAAILYQ